MRKTLVVALMCVALAACNSTAQQQAIACVAAVAPTVIADATAAGVSNAQKGINSGQALITNPACIAAAGAAVASANATAPAAAPATPAATTP